MTKILHIASIQVVTHGVLKIVWDDEYEGVVDLRPIIARGKVFIPLQDPEYFKAVRLAPYGHSIYWGEEDNEEVDFGCGRLREMAEELKSSAAGDH